MALEDNFGSLVLTLIIFITTLVNFSFILSRLEPLLLLFLYAVVKALAPPNIQAKPYIICDWGPQYEMT
jgi:uncharacterized membrane protein